MLWRTVEGQRLFRLPDGWRGLAARDIFGFPVNLDQGIPCTPLPILLKMPAGYSAEQLRHELRMLAAVDGSHPVTLDLHLAEPDSVKRAGYQATGAVARTERAGMIAGDRKVREDFLTGLSTESFSFTLTQPGNQLLLRRWYFEGDGQKLWRQAERRARGAVGPEQGRGQRQGPA